MSIQLWFDFKRRSFTTGEGPSFPGTDASAPAGLVSNFRIKPVSSPKTNNPPLPMAHRAALSSFRPFSVAGSVCRRTSPSAPPSWSVASALRAALLRQRPQPLARSQPPTVVLQSRGLRTTQQQPAKQGKATATARVVKPRSAANAIGLNSIKDNPGARITVGFFFSRKTPS